MPLLDEFFPFDIGQGSPANTARWRKMAQLWQSDGVFSGYLNQLNATLAGATVTVATGGLFIHGYYGEVVNPMAVTGVGTNGTIVAGVDLSAQTISIYYRDTVVDYGSNPTSNYQQDTNKWEIPLWLVSGTTLIDLRTMVTPGAACGWWGNVSGPLTVISGGTLQTNFLTLRVPFAGKAILRGELLLAYSDGSQAQSAICQLTYQWGASDQQLTPTMTPTTPGGGATGQGETDVITLSGLIPVTQGKKTVGWRVTAGTGPSLTMTTLTASVQMLNLPAAA
jgi:hypothetical protein